MNFLAGNVKWIRLGLVALAGAFAASYYLAEPFTPAPMNPAPSPVTLTPQSSSSTQPKITWSKKQIEVVLSPGESTTKTLTFTSTQGLQNVVIEPVPKIAPFLSIQPSTIANVPANQPQSVQVLFAIPAAATLANYEGTIHVRSGSQTLAHPLVLTLHVWETIRHRESGILMSYPPGWTSSLGTTQIAFFPNNKSPNGTLQYVGDITAEFLPNPDGLDLRTFYDEVATVDLFSNSASAREYEISGTLAVKFKDVNGMIPSDIIVLLKNSIIVELTDVGQLHRNDGVLDQIAKSIR